MVGSNPLGRSGVALAALLALGPRHARAQVALGPAEPVEARIWLDRGVEPIVQRGDRLRVYYRFRARRVHHDLPDRYRRDRAPGLPAVAEQDHYARGGRDYRLLFPGSPYWYVQDDPGVGYFFLVASPEPFDFSAFRFSPYARGWDLSLVGRRVYRDPYVATDDYVAALIPDWERAPYALDFATYNVGERYEYPRFLCYDCHGFRNDATWNPYYAACVSFRVVIFDDPYFYPARRYRSDRVVWTQPVARDRPRFAFREREGGGRLPGAIRPGGREASCRARVPPTSE